MRKNDAFIAFTALAMIPITWFANEKIPHADGVPRTRATDCASPAPTGTPPPSVTPSVTPSGTSTAAPASPTSGPAAGMTLAFHDGFDRNSLDTATWATRSWSYPGGGPTNRNDNKLDYLTNSAITSSDAGDGVLTITATRRSDGYWNTGLITTGNAPNHANGFKLRTGDFTVAHVRLPDATNMGAWPALWSWNDGDNEVDSFEWHTDNPDLLELSNHIRGGGKYYRNASLIGPGKWVYIGTKLGASSNTWYVGTTLDNMTAVYSDGTGVGSNWGGAYPILNLSVVAGKYHPAPTNNTPIKFQVGNYRVYR